MTGVDAGSATPRRSGGAPDRSDGDDRGDDALDEPVGASLRGRHAHLARRHGTALTYRPGVATFVAVPPEPGPGDWADLARLLGPGGFADLFSSPATPPAGWPGVFVMEGVQFVAPPGGLTGDRAVDGGVADLGPADVPAMLALADATRPGPFFDRTIDMGSFVGVREGGRLVAMAGERLAPAGWVEISAVCTAAPARGRGLAARLVRELTARIAGRGDRAFLHVATDNPAALRLYAGLGFRRRREVTFRGFRVPGG